MLALFDARVIHIQCLPGILRVAGYRSMSGSGFANLVAAIAAVLAFGALVISVWQARFTTRAQALLQLDAAWTSESMRATRRKAATSLLRGEATADVDRVLDFFETVAGLFVKPHGIWPFRSRVLPDRWAHHTFYWHAACYWSKSRDHIDSVRQRPSEEAAWEDLCDLIPRWIASEPAAPTPKDIEQFLEDERHT